MSLLTLKNRRERGFFDGQFLIAMPGMEDRNFARTVIYICAHSDAGAMGFVINRPQSLTFTDVLLHLDMIKQEDSIVLPKDAREFPIQTGGPVESGRGFVLHSDDYISDSSIPVSDDICLTATLDIVRAISKGGGPKRATMADIDRCAIGLQRQYDDLDCAVDAGTEASRTTKPDRQRRFSRNIHNIPSLSFRDL